MTARLPRFLGIGALTACALLHSSARALDALPTLITMDDLPNQPINGLVHPKGVTFGFTVGGIASTDARYNSGGPGETFFIDDPSIEGAASTNSLPGSITLIFAQPVIALNFGIAMSDVSTMSPGAFIQLFDSANVQLGLLPMTLKPEISFTEGQFDYAGAAVKRAVILLRPPAPNMRFVMDNLLFTAVPEPTSTALLAIAIGAMVSLGRRAAAK